jgi:glycosyltransferase involved in cell wall biosynthesis
MTSLLTVVIPARNEERHIERSVKSALRLTPNVYVIDSASTDATVRIAEGLGAKVFQYEWTPSSTFSKKINWAINELELPTPWAVRLDADEYFMDDCIEQLEARVRALPDDVHGCTLVRRIHFMGRWMRHSGEYPKTSLRVLRVKHAFYEERWLDEHVDLMGGKAEELPLDVVDDSHISMSEWINKHNGYSNKEAIELINAEIDLFDRPNISSHLDKNARKIRRKKGLYYKLPRYWRAFFFFCYRYVLQFGFLDGKPGFMWNFMQCWWYRTLCDAKVEEIYAACGKDKARIKAYVKQYYHLDI